MLHAFIHTDLCALVPSFELLYIDLNQKSHTSAQSIN